MSSVDLVIKNGRVAAPSLKSIAIGVQGGRINWIGSNANAPNARRVIDASDLLVLPGVMDVHVHLRDPGMTYKEDFGTGTAAAAAGGITTVFDMPNNIPPMGDAGALDAKIRAAREKALVDYALYGLLTAGNARDIGSLIDAGVIGFKCYMGETTGGIVPPPDAELLDDLELLAKRGMRTSVHAEDNAILQHRIAKLRRMGRSDAKAHYESRPELVEEEAVHRAIVLSREVGCKLHIAHLSSEGGAREVRQAKLSRHKGDSAVDVTAETCPQYLLLDKEDYEAKGSSMKSNPSVKRKEDRLALWMAVADGTVDMIASDHAPHALREKSRPSVFDQASGFPGLETSVALMLTCVNRGLLSLSKYVRLTSENPAKAWGVYPRKGLIAVGADADFTIVDRKKEWVIDPAKFVSKAKYSPFEGFKAKGATVYTVVRGNVVMDHGDIDRENRGEMLRPQA